MRGSERTVAFLSSRLIRIAAVRRSKLRLYSCSCIFAGMRSIPVPQLHFLAPEFAIPRSKASNLIPDADAKNTITSVLPAKTDRHAAHDPDNRRQLQERHDPCPRGRGHPPANPCLSADTRLVRPVVPPPQTYPRSLLHPTSPLLS